MPAAFLYDRQMGAECMIRTLPLGNIISYRMILVLGNPAASSTARSSSLMAPLQALYSLTELINMIF